MMFKYVLKAIDLKGPDLKLLVIYRQSPLFSSVTKNIF